MVQYVYNPFTSNFDAIGPNGGIGSIVTGGTPNDILYVDPSGNLGQDNAFQYNQTAHQQVLSNTATGISANNQADQVTNYERNVHQWQSNAYTIGNYAGGTGTIRSLLFGLQTTAGATTLAGSKVFTINGNVSVAAGIFDFSFSATATTGNVITGNSILNGASVTQNYFSIQPTINQTGTSSFSALIIQPYEQATGSGTKYLINAGTNTAAAGGGTFNQQFSVGDNGTVFVSSAIGIGAASSVPALNISRNGNTAAWGVSGVAGFRVNASTTTDNSSTGTVATTTVFNSIAKPTLSTTNTGVTYTNVATFYIDGAPVAGTNTPVFTNAWGIYSAASSNYLGGLTVGSTTMITSNVSFTNGAGASAATLTNAPAVGNPTKWIPVSDNGTTRYIPAW